MFLEPRRERLVEEAFCLPLGQHATRRIDALREEVWLPFEQRAKVLAIFGYLDYEQEKVTDRGRWLADLHIEFAMDSASSSWHRPTLAELEDQYIRRVLLETGGDKLAAARILGVSVRTLQRKVPTCT